MTPLVTRVGYVALDVRDFPAAVCDAVEVTGLAVVEEDGTRALLTSNQQHFELVLHRASKDGVRAIGIEGPDEAAVAAVAARARRRGLDLLSERPSLPLIEHAVTFATPEGHVFEIHTPIPADQPRRHDGPGIHPRRLCHTNIASQDPPTCQEILSDVLGLILSERTIGCELMWLRAADNRHHSIAIAKSARPGLHHFAWDIAQFTDFLRLGDLLDARDRQLVWGPGRHGSGDNLFAYYIDSAGFLVEQSSEMEIIPKGTPPRVIDCPPDLSNIKVVNRWGTPPPRAWTEHWSPFAAPRDEHADHPQRPRDPHEPSSIDVGRDAS